MKKLVMLGSLSLLLSACTWQDQSQEAEASIPAVAMSMGDNLDGSYKTMEDGEQLVLTLTGTTGVLTREDAKGKRSSEQVSLDSSNQSMTIGKWETTYRLKEAELTITEKDNSSLFRGGFLVFEKQ